MPATTGLLEWNLSCHLRIPRSTMMNFKSVGWASLLKASLGAQCLKAPGPFQWRQYTADMWYPFRVLDRISELAQGCNKMVQSCMHTTTKQELWWMHIIAILYMTLGIKICWLSNHATKWHMNIVILQYWWSQYYTYDKSAMTITRNYMWQVQKAQPYSTNTPQSKWSDQSGLWTVLTIQLLSEPDHNYGGAGLMKPCPNRKVPSLSLIS
jgi:hypothetical protein